jgi:phosphoribosylformimino-5-aminoimidazole carboxamide ribotide isomerase
MRIIPVIDLLNGQAVHAVAGHRAAYRPLVTPLCSDPSPVALAAVFAEQLRLNDLYVADLNAIQFGDLQWPLIDKLRQPGVHLWLDAGIHSSAHAQAIMRRLDAGRADKASLVVGLETFRDPDELEELAKKIGANRVVFSLDLKAGRPLAGDRWPRSPLDIARRVVQAGLYRLILLDLSAVGRGQGPADLPLCEALLAEWRHLELTTGGGIRSLEDLRLLRRLGCYAALIATALHDGRISVAEWIADGP